MLRKGPPPDLRRQILSYLIDRYGQAEVARRTGKPDRQIADIIAKRASFGEKVARSMESAWKKNTNEEIDFDHVDFIEAYEDGGTPDVEYIGAAPAQRLVAVVGQARLGENGWYDVVQEIGCDGFVEAVSSDPDAYALRVLGDSMFPAIRNGWYVVVEPNHALNPSDFVAVALTDARWSRNFCIEQPTKWACSRSTATSA